jgi:excisionase family DNA binding protein
MSQAPAFRSYLPIVELSTQASLAPLPVKRGRVSPAEYATLLGCSMSTVRRYLKQGKIAHEQPGGPRCRVFIPAAQPLAAHTVVNPSANVEAPACSESAATVAPVSERRHGPKPAWRSRTKK